MSLGTQRRLSFTGVAFALLAAAATAQANEDVQRGLAVEQVAQLGTRRFRHGSAISRVWFLPDQRIVSAGGQKLRVWDPDSGELVNEVRHEVRSQAFFDGAGRVLIAEPLENGVKTHTFRVVDINTGEQLATWRSPRWVETAALVHGSDFAVLGNLGRTVSIVDLRTGAERDRIVDIGPKSNQAGRPYVTLSGDSRRLAVESRSGHVRFYALDKNGVVTRLLSTIANESFHKVVFSSRADEVVLLGARTSSLWNIRTGKEMARWREPGPNRPSAAVFAAEGRVVAELADGVVRVRETRTGKQLRHFAVNAMPRVDYLALSADETLLAAGGFQGRVRLYDFKSGAEVGYIPEQETLGPVEAVAISDDGQWIASAEYTGVVTLWDGAKEWRRRTCPDDDIRGEHVYDTGAGPNFVTFLPGEARLLAGSGRTHNSVNLWDAATARRAARFVGHRMPITGVATSRDGRVIASSGRSSTRVWDRNGKTLASGLAAAQSVSVSPDGKLIAFPTRRELPRTGRNGVPDPRRFAPVVEVWDVASGALVRSMADIAGEDHGYGIYAVSFSHDGRLLSGISKEGLYIWRVATGERTRLFPVPQPEHEPIWHAPVRGCAFSPTANVVAAPTGSGDVYLVDAEAKVGGAWRLAIARGHDGPIASVAWRRDGSHLVSGGNDSTIVLWRVKQNAAK